jgi:transaldolase
MLATPSDHLRSADLSVWLEGWDGRSTPAQVVEGIAGLGLEHVGRAGDRWVQVECPLQLLRHTHALLAFARLARHRSHGGRVAIGLPCTPAGLAAATQLLRRGLTVGIGPVSTTATFNAVAACFTQALEARRAAALAIDEVGCVAWVPVGLVDEHADRCLPAGSSLHGTAGIAVAQLLYLQAFQTFAGPRWAQLRAAGAQPVRLGWSRLVAERRASYISRLTLPGSVIALGHPWAAEFDGHRLQAAEADETEARWTSQELVRSGVPLPEILAHVGAAPA